MYSQFMKSSNMFKFPFLILIIVTASFCGDQFSLLLSDIKNGPAIYMTPEAIEYYSKNGQTIQPSGTKDDAVRSFRAAIKIGDMGSGALAAVPVLLEIFPKAIHVIEKKSAVYSGEGSFDDWVSTCVMSEKNKFLFSSPFLDYNSMSQCDNFIETSHQIEFLEKRTDAGGTVKAAVVNMSIILAFNIGSCTLSRITGQIIGNDQNAWKLWWEQNGGSGITSEAVSDIPKPLSSGNLLRDIVVNGKYRMSLTTGDELIGFVESKDDSSVIFETVDGKPYQFSQKLIVRYDLLEVPKKVASVAVTKAEAGGNSEGLTFEEVLANGAGNKALEVRISNGSVFRGNLISIDESGLKLNIEGSTVPFSKEVIARISAITSEPKIEKTAEQPKKMEGPFDSIVVRNPQTDEWGKPKTNIVYDGRIIKDADNVTLELINGEMKEIVRSEILRVIKHSKEKFEEPIAQYAKSLFCPQDMFIVDLPPGKQGRPFFKVCVDRYEYPNTQDVVPTGNVSYSDAKKYCEQQGKRLCTAQEWQWACSGLEGYTYPYGWNKEEEKCNTDAVRPPERSGSRINCISKFGGYDMVGNIFEWVSGQNDQPMLMGGPLSKCQTQSPGVGGGAKPQTGFRCCKGN